MKTVVIGAGPAGLTAAYQLSKKMSNVAVYEASGYVGGLSRSFALWNQIVDIGPHRFFSDDHRVNEIWLEVAKEDYFIVNRQTRILYKGKLFRYPLDVWDVIGKLGLEEACKCAISYVAEVANPTVQDGGFEAWVQQRFGKRLFELFFKSYSEKLWGIPCRDLDADFAAQRIRKFSLSAAFESALFRNKQKNHRTLTERFVYPALGSGMIYERMARFVQQCGGGIHLNQNVRKIHTRDKCVVGVELSSGQNVKCDRVISTMPLTSMVRVLNGAPEDVISACSQLCFRNTILVYLEILNENPFADNWIYVHSPELAFGRVTNFRNWAPSICNNSPHTILALEFWCNSDDEMWKRDDQKLIEQAKRELFQSGVLGRWQKQLGRGFVLRVPKSYPVYRRGYQKYLKRIQEFLNSIVGLQAIGRYGAFKYNNQDHSILMGRLAADNILKNGQHDLWGVNSDYELYQEKCSIVSGARSALGVWHKS